MFRASEASPRRLFARFHPGIWAITVIGFLNAVGFSISLPFLSLYLYQDRHMDMVLVGLVMLVAGVFSAVTQMFAGAITDRFGRRPLLLATLLAGVFLYLGMALLIGASSGLLAIVIAYAAVRSVLMMMRPAMSAMVVDLSPKDRLTETYGLLRIAQNLGWAAGPAVGGYLASSLSYAWLFAFTGMMGAVALLIAFFFLRESFGQPTEEITIGSMFNAAKDRSFLKFTALSLLVFLVASQMISTLSVFAVDRAGFSPSLYGMLLTTNGLVVVLFQYPAARAIGRVTKYTALSLGSLLYGFGYLMMGWVGPFGLAVAAMVVITLGEITLSPTTLAVVGEVSPENSRGRYMGFFSLSETLGLSLGPMVGGILLDVFPATPVFIWGAISLLAFVAAAGFYRGDKSQRARDKTR
jgi:MFS family permease